MKFKEYFLKLKEQDKAKGISTTPKRRTKSMYDQPKRNAGTNNNFTYPPYGGHQSLTPADSDLNAPAYPKA